MCYIVQSANKEKCKIPEDGWKCDDADEDAHTYTAIYIGKSYRRMKCQRPSIPSQIYMYMLQLQPDGLGNHCEEFSYEFKDQELYISPHSSSEKADLAISKRPDTPDEWCLKTTKVESDPSATTTQPLSTQISHIKFSIEHTNKESHDSKEDKHAGVDRIYDIHVGGSQDRVLKVKESDILNTDENIWTLGYQVLQRHQVILMKREKKFFIRIRKADALGPPSTSAL
ncbi:unnamed protein product [Albugo candida]|nr:unnamed protein product [Albugo candida]|eukprot:CCI46417.1 unnamed protein product [Albugo candida]